MHFISVSFCFFSVVVPFARAFVYSLLRSLTSAQTEAERKVNQREKLEPDLFARKLANNSILFSEILVRQLHGAVTKED